MSNQITPNPSVPTQVVADGLKFPKFINNLGIIPTSYKDSMSYYECLAWLCKYLEETVIPTVNQNGEAVEELQNLYIELNSYVTNYFESLDVQEEINNKLDQMAMSGTLQKIIGDYFYEINDKIEELRNETNTSIEELREDTTSSLDSVFNQLSNEMQSLASGSPAGVYSTVSDLETDDPDHSKIYVVTATGKWYYYNSTASKWSEGGDYQSDQIAEGSIGSYETNSDISKNIEYSKTAFSQNYNKFVVTEFELGYITPSNGNNQDSSATVRNSVLHDLGTSEIIFKTTNPLLRAKYYCYDSNGTYDIDNSSGWLTGNTTFTPLANKKYRLVIGTTNDSAFNFDYLKQSGFFYVSDFIDDNISHLKELAIQNDNNYNINYKYMPFSANANTIIPDTKNINNIEEGSISWPNGNNWDGYPAYARYKGALEIKNCIVINLKPSQYEYRFIYYTEKGGYNSTTYKGATGFSSALRNYINNETDSNHSIYSRIIIHDKINAKIDFVDALNNVFIINQEDKINMKKPFIDVMLHQGGVGLGVNVPSNTLNAFTNASKYDVTGFETDVRKTSDGVFVISHDLERTTVNNVTININETSYSDLNNMQFYTDPLIKIPTLDQTLKNAKINGMKIDMELKDEFSQSDINNICDLVKQNSMEDNCVFSSFIQNNLLYVRNVFPTIKVIVGLANIIDPQDIETEEAYANLRTLRSQAKTLFSLENTTIASNLQTVQTYIENGFFIRLCYYGSDCSQITSLVPYADTILFNTEDNYTLLHYLR